MHMPSSKTIYHEKDRFRPFSQNGDRLISGHFSTWGIQNVKFNITVCIKYGETEAKKSLKWHYSYRNLIKKLLTLCVGGSSARDAFLFFSFLDTLKTELTVMAGGMDALADLHRFVH